jgi:hypothetical protein
MEKFQQIKELVASLEGDILKFYEKGNKTAGTRVRNAMQELKSLAQELRKEVQQKKEK